MSPGDEHEASGGYGGTGQTRTRLPDTGSDPYGTPRRGPRSSSRSLVTVVGVVVLLIAAIAFANRGGGDSPSAGGSTDKPETAATAPSGKRPVGAKTAGIPTGYAKDEQGAQSAATNYGIALGSADMYNTEKRHAIVNTVYAPDVAAAQLPAFDQVYSRASFLEKIGLNKDGSAPSGQTFVSRVIPVGTKVTSFSDSTATVALWYTSLFGLSGEGSTNPVTESWYTTTYQLKWVDGDWKVTDFTQEDGPVPVGRDQRASTAEDMTKAVEEYGGFTYAR
ncbi:hypothetical protein [Streptomyces lomondensis]|uniref:DUF8175 domain-containing protein n=1 Tax=Streptomyces lomondensis TaxID=68229 RepID=A0ABQ2XME6_9ACTN|nr:hypothetical protein [Streptomyces lomondensis]MCF0076399.1 hypothetical protein [Streptomyces lomondensis]GGX24859.1 hypothetical protein GCM10010383_64090 [Streptomyces lomondensis]